MNRIAYLIPTLDRIGGAEQQVILLATGLARRGWKVSVIALAGTGGDAAEKLKSAGVAFHCLEMRKGLVDPRGWFRLRAWIAQNRPDIIHAHLPHASLMARWSRMVSPVRVLVDTIHSPATGGIARRTAYRLSTSLADAVTAVSQASAGPWIEAGLVGDQKLRVIPNGVEADLWKRDEDMRATMRRELLLSDEFLWLAVGRLEAVKNHATLLKAFARLSRSARLVVAGSGPLEGELRTLATELGLLDRVNFCGFQSNVLPWMQAADGFVLCSSWEGLPISLLEAGACETPAVITDIAGSREVLPLSLRDGVVPVGDAAALAAAMGTMMDLPYGDRRELGRLTRSSICARFSLDDVLTRWEHTYRALLATNSQPSRFGIPASALRKTLQLQ